MKNSTRDYITVTALVAAALLVAIAMSGCSDRCDEGNLDHIRYHKKIGGEWTKYKDTTVHVSGYCIGDKWQDTKINDDGEFVMLKHTIKSF